MIFGMLRLPIDRTKIDAKHVARSEVTGDGVDTVGSGVQILTRLPILSIVAVHCGRFLCRRLLRNPVVGIKQLCDPSS